MLHMAEPQMSAKDLTLRWYNLRTGTPYLLHHLNVTHAVNASSPMYARYTSIFESLKLRTSPASIGHVSQLYNRTEPNGAQFTDSFCFTDVSSWHYKCFCLAYGFLASDTHRLLQNMFRERRLLNTHSHRPLGNTHKQHAAFFFVNYTASPVLLDLIWRLKRLRCTVPGCELFLLLFFCNSGCYCGIFSLNTAVYLVENRLLTSSLLDPSVNIYF